MLPVNDLKDVLSVFCAGIKTVVAAKADGKIDVADLGHLMILLPTLTAAYDGVENVPAQMLDMDDAEKADIIAHINAQLGDGGYEAIGESVLTGTVHFMMAVAKIKAMQPATPVVPV
jgi:hypothetical protein